MCLVLKLDFLRVCRNSTAIAIHPIYIEQISYDIIARSKDLMDKYKDEDAVKDLITRKTADGLWESNPDFPDAEDQSISMISILNISTILTLSVVQEHRTYWCWVSNEEIDRDSRVNTTTTRGTGSLDSHTARSLMCLP